MQTLKLGFKKLVASAQLPKRSRLGDIGFDLFSCEDTIVSTRKRKPVNTGIQLILSTLSNSSNLTNMANLTNSSNVYKDAEYYGRIAPRSGLSLKGIDVCAGVVDPNYTGSLNVILHNHSDADFVVKQGDRIAQLIIERCVSSSVPVYEFLQDGKSALISEKHLHSDTRGTQGFGSSGQ